MLIVTKRNGMTDPNPAFNDALHVFRSPTLISVVKEAVEFFDRTPDHPLPPTDRFIGPGVYGLYYRGDFEPYAPLSARNRSACVTPIYIGKAVPPGSRAARNNESATAELHSRLSQHANSISLTSNLNLHDFRCRFMILSTPESDLISTVESSLIRHYLPLWNAGIDGFGNHDPGAGRHNQAPSQWDILHPGRAWATRLTGTAPTIESILLRIETHFARHLEEGT